ncbi:MAG: metallophosphoesterase family protein [Candidatus Omnitrophota bacterium]|nr:metallophosphoesterase family protein [Candidatus Omnitrophota bacterium]
MKIGVIADTHIPERADSLSKEIEEAFQQADLIIHAGDFTSLEVLNKLKMIAPVKGVHGNMDQFDIVNILPKKDIVKCGKFNIGVFHGFGDPTGIIEQLKREFKNDKVDVIIFGHSHRPMNEKKENILFFNPGSPTDTVFAPFKSYGIIEINDKIEAKIVRLKI